MKTIYYYNYLINEHYYLLAATDKGLSFVGSRDQGLHELETFYPKAKLIEDGKYTLGPATQLSEYLTGKRRSFDLKEDISGTPFQEAVWQELKKIPYGAVSDYSQIAQAIGRSKAVRAVGSAIGKNPLLMVIPCHRVLTKKHELGGYRGGLNMKKDLLQMEQSISD